MRSHTRGGVCSGDGGRCVGGWWFGGRGGGVMLGQGGWRMSCNRGRVSMHGLWRRGWRREQPAGLRSHNKLGQEDLMGGHTSDQHLELATAGDLFTFRQEPTRGHYIKEFRHLFRWECLCFESNLIRWEPHTVNSISNHQHPKLV